MRDEISYYRKELEEEKVRSKYFYDEYQTALTNTESIRSYALDSEDIIQTIKSHLSFCLAHPTEAEALQITKLLTIVHQMENNLKKENKHA